MSEEIDGSAWPDPSPDVPHLKHKMIVGRLFEDNAALRSRVSALEAENGTLKVRISELERTQ